MPPTKGTTAKPSVSIIGPGRLGGAFAIALSNLHYPVLGLVARHTGKAEKALRTISRNNPRAVALTPSKLEQLPDTKLIIISTPDDAILETVERLARFKANSGRGRTVLHTSGALSSSVLAPLAKVGFHTGSIHPLISSSEPATGAEAFRGAFFCVEGDRQAKALATKIVRDLKGTSFSVPSNKKALYHAAAVMASPHLVALFDLATEMLADCGLSRKHARKVLLPLVASTVENLTAYPTQKALTGTFARGDLATVRRHLNALSEKRDDNRSEIYQLLGLHSLNLARGNRLNPKIVNQIKKLLKSR